MKNNRIHGKSFILGVIVCLSILLMLSAIKPLVSAPQEAQKVLVGPKARVPGTQNLTIEERLERIELKLQTVLEKEDVLNKDLHEVWAGLEREIRHNCGNK